MKPIIFICVLLPAMAFSKESISKTLGKCLKSESDCKFLKITYSDMHGLWGGTELIFYGNGKIEKKIKEGPAALVHTERQGSFTETQELMKLLIANEVWKQKEADRPAVPDESRAHLTIESPSVDKSKIWEWHNDLSKNLRLIKVKNLMTKMAQESSKSK